MKNVIVPKLSLLAKEVEIVKWHKKEGDHVNKDEPLLEIITEKANVEIEAPETGILTGVTYKEGDVVKVGETVALIVSEGETPPLKKGIQQEVRSTPIAKQLCRKSAITIEEVYKALGKEPITEQDVHTYLAEKKKPAGTEHLFEPMKLTPFRKVIAQRMCESASEKPHIYLFSEVEMNSLLKIKESLAEKMLKSSLKISLSDIIVKITASILAEFPRFNATLVKEGNEFILRKYKHINIGIAIATERGLVVPVIKDVGTKNIIPIARITKDLITKARENRLTQEDITGGSFTITNLGMYGVISFIPIINPPEVAITSLGTIREKLSFNGEIITKIPVMTVGIALDHRALDGADGAQFLQRFKWVVENPPNFSTG